MNHPVQVRSYNFTYKLSYKLYDHSTNIYEYEKSILKKYLNFDDDSIQYDSIQYNSIQYNSIQYNCIVWVIKLNQLKITFHSIDFVITKMTNNSFKLHLNYNLMIHWKAI